MIERKDFERPAVSKLSGVFCFVAQASAGLSRKVRYQRLNRFEQRRVFEDGRA
ncbi:hypothetical protein RISK_000019 [Rhodopirellula islandica]|uniref:Uncharacterized protein n=1 Tax=Rhodopirellula islandica TaxID=595434 RepID=A0A0J1BMW5_RHOIS|nr:hypothetical protein RISK_000019 [Rhodopirellula islandica]